MSVRKEDKRGDTSPGGRDLRHRLSGSEEKALWFHGMSCGFVYLQPDLTTFILANGEKGNW